MRRRVAALLPLLVIGAAIAPVSGPVSASSIVAEYSPGVTGTALGGQLTVNMYGVQGIGAFTFAGDGERVSGMCIQADVSHSAGANYQVATPVVNSGALNYLTWRYLSPGASLSNVDAAGMAVAIWAIVGARRSVGGAVIEPGAEIVVQVVGVGRRTDIEAAAFRFGAEAWRRRGPWQLTDLALAGGMISARLSGPGGGIGGRPVTFRAGDWQEVATTGDDGRARVALPTGVSGGAVTATTDAPGRAVELAAPGAQRFAVAGPSIRLEAALDGPATTTTSSTSSTTAATTTTSSPPAVSSSTSTSTSVLAAPPSTVPTISAHVTTTVATSISSSSTTTTSSPTTRTTTSTTSVPPETVPPETVPPETVPPETVPPSPPPSIAMTGGSVRTVVRIGASLFAAGGIAVYVAAGSRRARR